MKAGGLDPEDIMVEEIDAANAFRKQGFGTPILRENEVNELTGAKYPPSMKVKVNVRPGANNTPACIFVKIYEGEDGIRYQEEVDYHEFCNTALDTIPIVQVVGIMFKNDQWRVLISMEKLYKVGDGQARQDTDLLVDDDDVAPVRAPLPGATGGSVLGKRSAASEQPEGAADTSKVAKTETHAEPTPAPAPTTVAEDEVNVFG
jgi:hypothetical protein